MPGPGKTPTQLKVLRGTFRKDKVPENEPMPEKVEEYIDNCSHCSYI